MDGSPQQDWGDIDVSLKEGALRRRYQGAYTLLIGEGAFLEIYASEALGNYHPSSGQAWSTEEWGYLRFLQECQEIPFSPESITAFLGGDRSAQQVARYYLQVSDLLSYFPQFYEQDSELKRYERERATSLLKRSDKGSWLLRHSSLGRSRATKGKSYYAFSYRSEEEVKHTLLTFRLGSGWNIDKVWFPSLLDALAQALDKRGLLWRGWLTNRR